MATAPKVGDVYTFTADEPLGIDDKALLPGTKVVVRDLVDADTPGAHDDQADAVVVEWEDTGIVIDDDGRKRRGTILRSMSVPVAEQAIPGSLRQTGDGDDYTHPAFADLFTKDGK